MPINILSLFNYPFYLPTDSQTVEELVLDRLTLSNGTETTVLNTFGIKLNSVLGELETLLNKSGQLTNTTTLLTKNILGVSGTNDDSNISRISIVPPFLFIKIFTRYGRG
jgi:hypothetical protein